METTTNEIRDGFLFLTGLFLLILVIVSLTRIAQVQGMYSFHIRFDKAQSISSGATVQVSGVPVGRVTMVELQPGTNQSLVTVRVYESVKLHQDDVYTITSGGLVGGKYINITPNNAGWALVTPNSIVEGASSPDIDDIIIATSDLLAKLSATTNGLNAIIGDKETQLHFKQVIDHLERTAVSSAELTDNLNALLKDNRAGLTSTITELGNTTRSSSELVAGLNRFIQQHQADMDATIVGLRQTTTSSAELVAGLNQLVRRNGDAIDALVADLGAVSKDLRQISATLTPQIAGSQMVNNLDAASENVAKITQHLESVATTADLLLSDKALANAIRESADNMRKASADLQVTSATVKEITANVKSASGDLPGMTHPFSEMAPEVAQHVLGITRSLRQTSADISSTTQKLTDVGHILESFRLEPEGRVMILANGPQSSRTDLNIDLRNPSALMRVGISNIDNGNQVNAQIGNKLAPNFWLWYGAFQSNFGVGVDYAPGGKLRLTGELFDPKSPRANLLADYRLPGFGDACWLSTGWYDIFDRANTVGAGVVYRP